MVSLFFVLGTMVEFAIVLLLKEKSERNAFPTPEIQGNFDKTNLNQTSGRGNKALGWRRGHSDNHEEGLENDIKQELVSAKVSRLTRRIDYAAFVFFYAGYFIFNFVYFLYYQN